MTVEYIKGFLIHQQFSDYKLNQNYKMNKIPQKDLDMYPLEKEFVSKINSNQ